MAVIRLDRDEARRIAVRAQLLHADRPVELLPMVRQLSMLRIEQTAVVAPAADLIAWSRLGAEHRPADLPAAVARGALFELDWVLRPIADLPLERARIAAAPGSRDATEWLAANDGFRRDILARLADTAPLTSTEIPDTSEWPWPSTGWTNDRNVTMMLDLLHRRGELAVVGRVGRLRQWDLAERVWPATPELPESEARPMRERALLRSLGVSRPIAHVTSALAVHLHEVGEPAVIDGIAGEWRVDPDAVGRPFAPRTAVLSPFDQLIADRARAEDLFDFEYALEMYKPVAKRRWGYFALPVMHGDRLVGKIDAGVDRRRGTLVVHAVHRDVAFTATIADAVQAEIESLAAWLALDIDGEPARRGPRTRS